MKLTIAEKRFRRAARVGARVSLLRVIDPPQGEIPFLGVAEVRKTEAEEEARQVLTQWVALAQSVTAETPETVIKHGDVAAEIFRLIEANEDIAPCTRRWLLPKGSRAARGGVRAHCGDLSTSCGYRTGTSAHRHISAGKSWTRCPELTWSPSRIARPAS